MLSRRHLVALSGCGWMSLGTPLASQAPSFRSSVNLVLLDVLVTDDSGRPVTGLDRSNFRVKEMNRVVTVDRVSDGSTNISVGLILDYSRSMIRSQARVVQAAEQLRSRLAADDEAFVLTFNEHVKTVVEPARVGTEMGKWTTPLYKAAPDGMTALYDAIVQGANTLRTAGHARRAMLVLSDGKDTASRASRNEAAQALLESNTLFYGIGLFERYDLEADTKTLASFAEHTGGRAVFEPKLDLLAAEFDKILSELRARYVLGFLTSEPESVKGETRRVKVFATGADGRQLRVRTRDAFYIASSAK